MNNRSIVLLVLAYTFLVAPSVEDGEVGYFGYTPAEQNAWPKNFRECGGSQQSPIWIDTSKLVPKAQRNENLKLKLQFKGYKQNLPELKLTNTGYTVDLSIDAKSKEVDVPYLTVGNDSNKFKFQGLHFHWGKSNDAGSEHIIDDIKSSMELHIVHMTEGKPIKKENTTRNDIAVLAVLYKLSKKTGNALNPIFRNLFKVQNVKSTTSITSSITLASFLEHIDQSHFYTYKGSLTTPPCTENVRWFVFKDMLTVSPVQLKKLRKLRRHDKQGRILRILENNRWTQPLNNRKIELVFK